MLIGGGLGDGECRSSRGHHANALDRHFGIGLRFQTLLVKLSYTLNTLGLPNAFHVERTRRTPERVNIKKSGLIIGNIRIISARVIDASLARQTETGWAKLKLTSREHVQLNQVKHSSARSRFTVCPRFCPKRADLRSGFQPRFQPSAVIIGYILCHC